MGNYIGDGYGTYLEDGYGGFLTDGYNLIVQEILTVTDSVQCFLNSNVNVSETLTLLDHSNLIDKGFSIPIGSILGSITYFEKSDTNTVVPGIGNVLESFIPDVHEKIITTSLANSSAVLNVTIIETLNLIDKANYPIIINVIGDAFGSLIYQTYANQIEVVFPSGNIFQEQEVFVVTVFFKNIYETLTLSETTNTLVVYGVTVGETLSAIDFVEVFGTVTDETINETLSIFDSTNFFYTENADTTEAITLIDIVDSLNTYGINETLTLIDMTTTTSNVASGSIVELFTTTDATAVIGFSTENITEIITLLDSVVSNNSTYNVQILETVTAIDTVGYGAVVIIETLSANDSVKANNIFSLHTTESLVASDIVSILTKIEYATIAEALTANDSVSANIVMIVINENLFAQDTVLCRLIGKFNIIETLTLIDNDNANYTVYLMISENDILLDITNQIPDIIEVTTLTDQSNANYGFNVTISETVISYDLVNTIPDIIEVTNASDQTDFAFVNWYAEVVEFCNSTDIVEQIPDFIEAGNLRDTTGVTISVWSASVIEVLNAAENINLIPDFIEVGNLQDTTGVAISVWLASVVEVLNAVEALANIPDTIEVENTQDITNNINNIFNGDLAETLSSTDVTAQIPDFIEIVDTIDSTSCSAIFTASVVENVSIIDVTNATNTYTVSVVDHSNIIDICNYSFLIQELLFPIDRVNYTSNFQTNIYEILNGIDFVDFTGNTTNEVIFTIDQTGYTSVYSFSINENINLEDFSDGFIIKFTKDSLFCADFTDASVTKQPIINTTPQQPQNVNIFQTNPNTCGVMSLLDSETAFSKDLVYATNNLNVLASQLAFQLNSIPESILNEISFDAAGLAATLTGTIAYNINAFASHLSNQITNLIPNLNIATGQLSIQAGLFNSGCGLPGAGSTGSFGNDPCSLMGNFFNSLMGGGEELLNVANTVINAAFMGVSNLLSAPLEDLQNIADGIVNSINQAANFASSMANMATNEINNLANALTNTVNFTATNTLLALMTNPCFSSIITQNATPQAQVFLEPPYTGDPVYAGS